MASCVAYANHPVFVEGNCPSAPSSGLVTIGGCGDYDNDGRIGVAEDNDGVDRVFGTIAAALGAPGIIVNAAANTRVTLRNLVSRNWTNGIDVRNASRVTIEDCRVENNLNYGIQVTGQAKVKVDKCSVTANGFRNDGPAGAADGPANANPGAGINFEANARGAVFRTNVSGNLASGISGASDLRDNYVFDNNPDYRNTRTWSYDSGGYR